MQQELADGQVFEIKSNHLILKIYTKATFFESFFLFKNHKKFYKF